MLALLLLLLSGSALAGPRAHDLRDMSAIEPESMRPSDQLDFASSTRADLQVTIHEVGTWIGDALVTGNDDRLTCLSGLDSELLALLGATEDAARDLRPSVLDGNHDRALRELRRIQVAGHRGRQVRAIAFECAQLVPEPIEVMTLPPAGAEPDLDSPLAWDPLDAMATGPW